MYSTNYSRSLWLIGLLALSAMIFTCFRYNMILVHGQQHDYLIPQSYDASDGNMAVYDRKLVGADNIEQEAYLRFSHKDMSIPELGPKWELSWLLFWDKDYSTRFRTGTNEILENAKQIGSSIAGFQHYHEILGGTSYDTYVSLNHKHGPTPGEAGDYYVKITKRKPLKIGDKIITPRTSCELNTIHDGILIEVGTSDGLCEVDHFPALYQSVVNIMGSWKVKEAPD